MELAISNLAWLQQEKIQIGKILKQNNIRGLEVIPGRSFKNYNTTTEKGAAQVARFWARRGISLVAMQSLTFGKPELQVFGSEDSRRATHAHLIKMMDLARTLGVPTLVFGSPKNRVIGDQNRNQAIQRGLEFFNEVGNSALERGVKLLIEPVSAGYGCDFATTTQETFEFVQEVANAGIGMHLDTGTMSMNGEDIASTIASIAGNINHVHISEPKLGLVGPGPTNHALVAACLKDTNYNGWVSIEMLNGKHFVSDQAAISDAISLASEHYLY
jgi:D-psicose/D-tagatose/L-ribulose 3-epimerase